MNGFLRAGLALATGGVLALASADARAGGFVDLYPGDFDFAGNTWDITNPWWPLSTHDRWVYFEEEECVLGIVDVLPGTSKTIKSVQVRTVLDQEFVWIGAGDCPDPDGGPVANYSSPDAADWYLAEKTHDWYAQDEDGNVWYFGEYTVATDTDPGECDSPVADTDPPFYLEGCLDGSWEAGVPDANTLEGIIMLAGLEKDNKGDFYFQEYWEDEATDMARILGFRDVETYLHGDQEGCAKIKEWVPLEPGNVEHKYYCEGYGLEFVEANAGGPTVYEVLIAIED